MSSKIEVSVSISDQQKHDLLRFHETTEDDQGYDVPKDRMKSLARLGLIRSLGFSRYEFTDTGSAMVEALAAPVVERQPVRNASEVAYNLQAELAELQATIAQLTTENEAVKFNLDKTDKRYLAAVAEIERLKGGQGEPVSVDEINAENAPTFMGEPNPHHSIDWYQEGIAKHWKTICRQRAQIETLTESLKFYADRDHYSTDDGLNWDSCSGEPSNILWHEEKPWFIEDGTVARACLDKVKELNQ